MYWLSAHLLKKHLNHIHLKREILAIQRWLPLYLKPSFLHMNRALWDERAFMEALVAVSADQKDERLKKKLELANEQEENEEGYDEDSVGDDNEK